MRGTQVFIICMKNKLTFIFKQQTQEFEGGTDDTYQALINQYFPKVATNIIAVYQAEQYFALTEKVDHALGAITLVEQTDPLGLALVNYQGACIQAALLCSTNPQLTILKLTADQNFFSLDFSVSPTLKEKALGSLMKEHKTFAWAKFKVQQSLLTPEAEASINQNRPANLKTHFTKQEKYYHQSPFFSVASQYCLIAKKIARYCHLINLAGSYWEGDASNPMIQRIHGVARFDKANLAQYIKLLQTQHERDHRYVNKTLNLFAFDIKAGKGFPLWLKNGMLIKQTIKQYIAQVQKQFGFEEVQTSIFGAEKLYQISGHLEHYQNEMFPVMEVDKERLILRPMTCPHHILLYKAKKHSYRDLPIRYCEDAMLFRYEASGGLSGLERVRNMELTDAHLFVRPDQLEAELLVCLKLIHQVLADFKIKIDYYSLSLHDPQQPEKYCYNPNLWQQSELVLEKVLNKLAIPYQKMVGEAAFYGPKIDIQVKTALNREITMSTMQLDFLQPERFAVKYSDEHQQPQAAMLIHRSLIGTYERFLSILLEQYGKDLPFWLCPVQAVVIPVSLQAHQAYAATVFQLLQKAGFRIESDFSEARLSYKVRQAQQKGVYLILIVGDEEQTHQTVSVRLRHAKTMQTYGHDALCAFMHQKNILKE